MSYTTVSELSIDEFKSLISEVVEQTITNLIADPDEGLDLCDDVKSFLQTSLKSVRSGEIATISAQQVAANLGLEW
ncbi:MAG: hypothetical protein U9Q82_07970 [Chloroflexota bacterium]|nr:hypothetical protein [Chloroflexota bacterium]